MEEIKVSSTVEFEVIYADGERKRVQEGILFGVEEDGTMVLHNGTDCAAVWFTAADAMLVAMNTCDALPKFVLVSMTETESFHALKKLAEEVRRRIWLKNPATFCLGQMDLRESAADMLEDAAKQAEDGIVASTYLQAAALVRDMEIPGGGAD